LSPSSSRRSHFRNGQQTKSCASQSFSTKEFPGSLLYYGKYTQYLRIEKCLDELIWKRSELTGKYIGCPYWSIKARAFFDSELKISYPDRPVSLEEASNLAIKLSKKNLGDLRLEHEHVFPKKYLIPHLLGLGSSVQRKEVDKEIERLAIACVVLHSEHPNHNSADADNPWLRYAKAEIALVNNSDWTSPHDRLIVKSGLSVQA
jgi:hypothetical protein